MELWKRYINYIYMTKKLSETILKVKFREKKIIIKLKGISSTSH
jgi:hypothetical protein